MRRAVLALSIIFLVSTVLLFSAVHVQPAKAETPAPPVQWEKTYGGTGDDEAIDLVQTLDGGYALAGFGFSHLVKTDEAGTQEWTRSYSINDVRSLFQTNDGGLALAGLAGGLVKTDSNGNVQWSQNYPDIRYYALVSAVQTKDGGYAYAGQSGIFGINTDFRLIKTDSNGAVQWTRDYDKTIDDWVNSVIQTSDGGYLLAGDTEYPPYYPRTTWLVKTDQNGNLQWENTYGGEGGAASAIEADDGGFVVVGTSEHLSPNWDLWVFKISSDGTTIWSKTFGGTAVDEGRSVIQTADGGYAVAGITRSVGAGNGDFWVIKLDGDGEQEWDLTVGGPEIDMAWSIIQTTDFGYAVAGYTESYGAGLGDFWLVKLGADTVELVAKLSIIPDTLNLRSNGKWITGYIELPHGYDVAEIDVSTLLLNATIPAELSPTAIGDHDFDGIPDLMVKFNRTLVSNLILSQSVTFGNVTLIVNGQLMDGTPFSGNDMIRVSGLMGDVNCDGRVDCKDVMLGILACCSHPDDRRWNDNANFAPPWDTIDLRDVAKILMNFGRHY